MNFSQLCHHKNKKNVYKKKTIHDIFKNVFKKIYVLYIILHSFKWVTLVDIPTTDNTIDNHIMLLYRFRSSSHNRDYR